MEQLEEYKLIDDEWPMDLNFNKWNKMIQKELKDIIIYNPKNNIFIKKIDSFIYR